MTRNRFLYIAIALALAVLGTLTIRTAIATSVLNANAQDLSDYALRRPNAVILIEDRADRAQRNIDLSEKHFPGKEQDDQVIPNNGVADPERYFPGKEKDDLVILNNGAADPERLFPGKEKDDVVILNNGAADSERHFPGKEKDDVVIPNDAAGIWHTPAYQGYTP